MQVLADPELDQQLGRDGFVVVDLLDRDQVRALRDAWESLSRTDPPRFDPTGLAATVRHPGLDRRADAHVRAVMEPLVRSLMVGRVPFMSSYLVKRPHSAALPAHIDWRLADEPRHLTHGCWVPLTPAATDTGAFGVVPGSHLVVDFDRTPEDPGHEWTAEHVAGGAPTLLLEVEVGRAVVYDHRLVHFSTANGAGDERIAVNSGISAEDEEERARELLLDMMRRGMSSAGGSQLDPTAGHDPSPTEGATDAADLAAPGADTTDAPPAAPTTAPAPRRSGWRRLRRRS